MVQQQIDQPERGEDHDARAMSHAQAVETRAPADGSPEAG
jgi:hypothetical protein